MTDQNITSLTSSCKTLNIWASHKLLVTITEATVLFLSFESNNKELI